MPASQNHSARRWQLCELGQPPLSSNWVNRPAPPILSRAILRELANSLRNEVRKPRLALATHEQFALYEVEQGVLHREFASLRTELERFLQSRGMSAEDAEDLLQDLYIGLDKVDQEAIREPKAYLYRMANNLAHDRRRNEASRKRREGAWIALHADTGANVDASWNTEELLQARDLLRRVETTLNRLPDRTALIFRLHRMEGESQKGIAEALGISLSAVEKHLQRAYRAVLDLRRMIKSKSENHSQDHEIGRRDA